MYASEPIISTAVMQTAYGPFHTTVFEHDPQHADLVLVARTDSRVSVPMLRVQAHCLTGTAFKSRMCDCGTQIDSALRILALHGWGVLVYLDQEGRNYGLASKIQIMQALNAGYTIAQARSRLGRCATRLDYTKVPFFLANVGVHGMVDVLTTNEEKITALRAVGLQVRNIQPLPMSDAEAQPWAAECAKRQF